MSPAQSQRGHHRGGATTTETIRAHPQSVASLQKGRVVSSLLFNNFNKDGFSHAPAMVLLLGLPRCEGTCLTGSTHL